MHVFDPELSLKANYQQGFDAEFAAWHLAGHDHREEFRDSGALPARSAWLRAERTRLLQNALANGELLAIGLEENGSNIDLTQIPENLFLSTELRIDCNLSSVSAIGREFLDIRICKTAIAIAKANLQGKSSGRPNKLLMCEAAWIALKKEIPNFIDLDKTIQNMEIQEILEEALKRGASDIHLMVGTYPTLRINGDLIPIAKTSDPTPEYIEKLVFTLTTPEQKELLLTNETC